MSYVAPCPTCLNGDHAGCCGSVPAHPDNYGGSRCTCPHASHVSIPDPLPTHAMGAHQLLVEIHRLVGVEPARLKADNERLRLAVITQSDEITQTLGRALNYPWFRDDQVNFPGATDENGVCVGEHVAETLAAEAARTLVRYRATLTKLRDCDWTIGRGNRMDPVRAIARAALDGTETPE